MAEDYRGRPQEESQYPPPPGEEDERPRSYHPLPPPQMATGVTLPSISDPYGGSSSRYPPPDPRSDARSSGAYSASPTSVNGYAPPSQGGPPMYLPSVQAQDQQRQAPYAGDSRDYYGGPQRRSYPHQPDSSGYAQDPYPHYNGYRGQPPPGPYPAYPVAVGMPQQQQAAPRQRTSIACRYCRKRKIRCSGYQNTPDGKCTNCKKTGNECIFQPVSSSSSTAFIPVSAVPGGVPPGTPLYGAFGQPLPPTAGGPPAQPAPYPQSSGPDYALPSPTAGSYYPHVDDRSQAGMRRPRPQDDEPVSISSNTPPTTYNQYPHSAEYDSNRTPTPRRNSPGGSTGSAAGPNIMRLDNLMDVPPRSQGDASRDIDQRMLGRLNRRQ